MAAGISQVTPFSCPLRGRTSNCGSSVLLVLVSESSKRPGHGRSPSRFTSVRVSSSSQSQHPIPAKEGRDSDDERLPPRGVASSATIRTKGAYVSSGKLKAIRLKMLGVEKDDSSSMERNVEGQDKKLAPRSRTRVEVKHKSLDAPTERRMPRLKGSDYELPDGETKEMLGSRADDEDDDFERMPKSRSTSYDKSTTRFDSRRGFSSRSSSSRSNSRRWGDNEEEYDDEFHRMLESRSTSYDKSTTRFDSRRGGSSSSNSRRWGDEGSVHSFRPRSQFPSQRHDKFSSGSDFFSRKSFRDIGCKEYIIEALKGQLLHRPSHIQAMAFSPVIEGKTCVISDQSGSGKTLAYLLPAIQRFKEEEKQAAGEPVAPKTPQVFIMVPTAELASQVLNNCRSMSKFGVRFRSMVATGGFRQKTQLETLEQGVDLVIATPGRFLFLIKQGVLKLENLRCAVLDEIDILFKDDDFEAALQLLISSSPITAQYLFVTATLPVDIYNKLVEIFPDCAMIMGPAMHRTSVGLEEVLVDCSGDVAAEKTPETAFENKKSALLQLAEQSPVSKTIVFCNKIETCRKVENVLKRFDRKGINIQVLPFHAALAQESRLANMKDFMNPHHSPDQSLFLVCTDRASRGIDFAGVDHVVLFDFPRDPSEYVRRVGRTARGAGGKGKAFAFVVGKQVSLARRIIERNQKGHPLHDVPAAYELMSS
ncbi:unnamed protein product [Linum tenue]|uniref:DEAD-box ATP-dependent RNA helicase 50 n=1 Tax=Linum tenue TaxID=586396 RepID=A0AAV0GNH7_9ROSI|nr:unnamed protein product [Linum tenue]